MAQGRGREADLSRKATQIREAGQAVLCDSCAVREQFGSPAELEDAADAVDAAELAELAELPEWCHFSRF